MCCGGSHLGFPIHKKTEALKSLYRSPGYKKNQLVRQLKPNCPGMIIGRSSTNFLFFMPIGNPRWLPPQVIVLTQDHMGKIQKYLSRACIAHLVIKRTNWSYVKNMSCSGSHLGISINIKNTRFVKDLPMINFVGMVLGWSPSKFVSSDPSFQPRWPLS
jgi:hypothetical protein